MHQSPFAWHQARLTPAADAAETAKTILASVFLIRGVNWSLPENLNPPAWSLGVEVTFYLIAPLVVAASKRNPLLIAAAGLVVLFILKRFEPRELGIFYFFWIGILACEVHRRPATHDARLHWVSFVPGCALTVYFLLLPLVDLQGHHLYPRHYRTGFLALGLLLVLLAAPRLKPVAAMLSIYPLRFIGIVSYSAFLLHFPLYSVLGLQHLPRLSAISSAAVFILGVLPAVLCVAALSFAMIERPFIARRKISS